VHIRTLANGTNLATIREAHANGQGECAVADETPDWSGFLTLAAYPEIVLEPGQARGARLESPDVVTRALAIRQLMIQAKIAPDETTALALMRVAKSLMEWINFYLQTAPTLPS
jgi:hypothetical protein